MIRLSEPRDGPLRTLLSIIGPLPDRRREHPAHPGHRRAGGGPAEL